MSRHNQWHLVEAHVSLANCCVPHALPVCLRHGFTLTRPCFIVIRLEQKLVVWGIVQVVDYGPILFSLCFTGQLFLVVIASSRLFVMKSSNLD